MTTTLERLIDEPPASPVHATAAATAPGAHASFRPDIGGLRAVAVLLVVLYHAHVPGITGGYAGVDVFFVISGFLITGQLVRELERRGRIDLVAFYARRLRRLLPAAMLVAVATAVAAMLWGPLLQVRATATDALYAALYAINFHLAAQGVDYQQANGPVSPLQHFWSLAVEEQFYLLWPIIVVATTVVVIGRRRRAVRPLLGVVAVVGTALSLYWSAVVTQRSAPTAYFSVQTRAWEFGVGALVALGAGWLVRQPRWWCVVLSWAGLAAIVVTGFYYDDETPFPGTAALLPVLATGALIAAGCRGGGSDRLSAARLLSVRPAQWIGRVSYGWYLWHWPMLVLAPSILGYDLSWVRGVEISILALWLAALTHLVIERPTQRPALRRMRWTGIGVALSLGAVGASVAVAAAAPYVGGDGRFAAALDFRTTRISTVIADAGRSVDVPGNLTPTLGHAADDVPVTQSSCHLDFLQVRQDTCAFGDVTASRTVVLFGDSHAQQWDAAFISAAQNAHWRVISWTKAACPVAAVHLVNPQLKREYHECDTWRAATVRRIIALAPALVVASQSDTVPGRGVSNSRWAAATVQTLQQLRAGGVRVDFLADTPAPRSDVPTCVAAHLDNIRPCEVTRDGAYHYAQLYTARHALVSSVVRAAGLPVIDPLPWLCGSIWCPVIVGNELVYRDDSHLTDTYSRALAPLVEPLLTRARR